MISIKSKLEIENMRYAGSVISEFFKHMGNLVKPGISLSELDRFAEKFILDREGIPSFKGYNGFKHSICTSLNDEVIHGSPRKRKLIEGDILSIDIGVKYNGCHADAARTFAVGEIDEKVKRLIDDTKESFFQGLKMCREGKRVRDITSAIQEYAEGAGLGIVREYCGHGVGRKLHEPPDIPNYNDGKSRGARLYAGMAFAIEPMMNMGRHEITHAKDNFTVLTKDGSLSAHYENTVLITKGEPEVLTLNEPKGSCN